MSRLCDQVCDQIAELEVNRDELEAASTERGDKLIRVERELVNERKRSDELEGEREEANAAAEHWKREYEAARVD